MSQTLAKLIFLLLFLRPVSSTGTPDISVEVFRFNASISSYIEVSLYVIGSTLISHAPGSEYGIEYLVMVKDSTGDIVAGNKYKLSSSNYPVKDIMDVQRFALVPGKYVIEMEAHDIMDTFNLVNVRIETELDPYTGTATLSDIQLLSTIKPQGDNTSPLHKSGLYMEPLPFRFYYPELNTLFVYLESYDADRLEGQAYLQYTIQSTEGNIPAPMVAYKKVKKESMVSANVFQLDIKDLISGAYQIEVGLYDGNRQLHASRKIDFSRSNPIGDSIFVETAMLKLDLGFVNQIPEDSLDYDLKAMAPIVTSADVDVMNALLVKGSSKAKRYFIHRYWTHEAGKFAGPAFYSYMKVALVVDENYRSGFGYGFETDRGHIFLKYGKPDEVITVEDEPSAPPYEIWFYNQFPATHQTNVRFLFYNPSLVRNGFQLLHSTALGELRNERWEIELYRDAGLETPGVNDREMPDNVYRNARKYFEY